MKREGILFVTNLHFKSNGNGGQQRTYFMIKELASHFDLVVVSPYSGGDEEVKGIDATFVLSKAVEARKMMQRSIHGRLLAKITSMIFKMTNSSKNHIIYFTSKQLRKQIINIKNQKRYDHLKTIVFDTIRTAEKFDNTLFKRRILNAHNFDFEISENQLLKLLKDSNSTTINIKQNLDQLLYVKSVELDIDTYFDEIWTCSEDDIEKFKIHNPNTKVTFACLPNGSDTEARNMQDITNNYKKLLFVGSLNYFPNVNGLEWFVNTIFKNLPSDFELTIVGKSPKADDFKFVDAYDNIHLIGEVDDVQPYYASHDVVIVPVLEGSGTRLKILEAFSYGKLVLSTAKGIEGIEGHDGEHFIKFENLDDFDSKFIKNHDLDNFESIRKRSRQLVEDRYSWKGIVSGYSKKLYGA